MTSSNEENEVSQSGDVATSSDVLVERVKNSVMWLQLNRPKAKNALNFELIEKLVSRLKVAEHGNAVKSIVITGGNGLFCAGGDIKAMKTKSDMFSGDELELRQNYRKGIQQIPLTIESLSKPVIAAIDGPAVGAGFDLAMMCDLRIATPNSMFRESFAQLGLVPGDGGAYFLNRVVGYAKAMEILLKGERMDAKKALDLGLISEIVESSDLEARTQGLAETLNQTPQEALRMTKLALRSAWKSTNLNEHLELMSAYQGMVQRSSEHLGLL